MQNRKCDLIHPSGVKEKKMEVIDGYTIKYHTNTTIPWSKGKMVNGQPEGYWEWYRLDGTIKRSGNFENGNPIGEWITYDNNGAKHKTTQRN
jgi:antitoxin component YwqK of YwqJK toxin-antitoxin module